MVLRATTTRRSGWCVRPDFDHGTDRSGGCGPPRPGSKIGTNWEDVGLACADRTNEKLLRVAAWLLRNRLECDVEAPAELEPIAERLEQLSGYVDGGFLFASRASRANRTPA